MLCWHGERFSLVFFDVTMQNSLLGWRKIRSCLFRYNKAEFSLGTGNDSVVSFSIYKSRVLFWDGERLVLSFSI